MFPSKRISVPDKHRISVSIHQEPPFDTKESQFLWMDSLRAP